ncbi:MAG: hypothetical protein H8E29_14850 [Anaerolineales bacterium]|uniref:Uncharacterized protein n=1 Tax=Candidatus Desulfolinea nitratireducens TaxID=2841698 RepID=A0A8J6TH22_9CHLR|nr:hypothetical protein [Candidatus Desulfolinea nitratireducens]
MSESLLLIGGIYSLVFAVFHLLFWQIFDWKNDLAKLSSINRAIMQVINLCLALVFVIFGMLSLRYRAQMLETELGRALTAMIAFFWFLRAIEQIIFFKLKKGISWLFLFIFLGGTSLYAVALFAG